MREKENGRNVYLDTLNREHAMQDEGRKMSKVLDWDLKSVARPASTAMRLLNIASVALLLSYLLLLHTFPFLPYAKEQKE